MALVSAFEILRQLAVVFQYMTVGINHGNIVHEFVSPCATTAVKRQSAAVVFELKEVDLVDSDLA